MCMCMFSQIQSLPDEIIRNINEYIPYDTLTWLSKTHYDKYHATIIQKHIKKTGKKLDTYLRSIIRLDNYIALQDMLNNSVFFDVINPRDNCTNTDKHISKSRDKNSQLHNHKIKYKNKKYANIIDFLLYLSIENEKPSTKCKNVLFEYVKK